MGSPVSYHAGNARIITIRCSIVLEGHIRTVPSISLCRQAGGSARTVLVAVAVAHRPGGWNFRPPPRPDVYAPVPVVSLYKIVSRRQRDLKIAIRVAVATYQLQRVKFRVRVAET